MPFKLGSLLTKMKGGDRREDFTMKKVRIRVDNYEKLEEDNSI
jgi:hypothetical protein